MGGRASHRYRCSLDSLYIRSVGMHYSSGLAKNLRFLLSLGGAIDTPRIKVPPRSIARRPKRCSTAPRRIRGAEYHTCRGGGLMTAA
jgi:hypothetical protein